MTMSRAQRRRFGRHQPSVDRVTAADAAFFTRHPGRQHRVRLAAAAEVAQNAIMAERDTPMVLMPGARHVVLVKQLMPGVRLRAFAQAVHADDFDLSEDEARALYDSKVRSGTYQHSIETQMRAGLATAGGRQP